MNNTTSPVESFQANQMTGALAGFEVRCSCGLVMRNSLRTSLDLDVRQHNEWHRKTGR